MHAPLPRVNDECKSQPRILPVHHYLPVIAFPLQLLVYPDSYAFI